MKLLSLLFFFIAEFVWAAEFNVPLNEFEQPDLSGVWNFNDSTPFERPENFGQRNFFRRKSWQIEKPDLRKASNFATKVSLICQNAY